MCDHDRIAIPLDLSVYHPRGTPLPILPRPRQRLLYLKLSISVMLGFLSTPWAFLPALLFACAIWIREARDDLATGWHESRGPIDRGSSLRARLSASYLDRRREYQRGVDGWAWVKATYPSAWVDEMNKGGFADLTVAIGRRIYRTPY